MSGANKSRAALLSPTRRAILQHLQMHGERTREQILEALGHFTTFRAAARDNQPAAHAFWLGGHLMALRAGGHIVKRVNEAQQVVYNAGTEPVEIVDPAALVEDEAPGQVVPPRQLDVMRSPVYQPGDAAPTRAGAAGHRQIPSLIGGRRVPYRSAS